MHNFNRALARRVERLERELAGRHVPLSLEEQARQDERRLELCRGALEGVEPGDLTEEERRLYARIRKHAPVFQELTVEGTLDGYLDGDAPDVVTGLKDLDGYALNGDDLDGDDYDAQEGLVWRP